MDKSALWEVKIRDFYVNRHLETIHWCLALEKVYLILVLKYKIAVGCIVNVPCSIAIINNVTGL